MAISRWKVIAGIVLCLALSARAVEPSSTQPATTAQANRIKYDCMTRLLVDAYRSANPADTEIDRRAVEFLDGMARFLAELPDSPPATDLERAARELYIDGCDDPLVLGLFGRVMWEMNLTDRAAPFLQQGFEGLPAGSFNRLLVAPMLIAHLKDQKDVTGIQRCIDAVTETARSLVDAQVFEAHEQPILYKAIREAYAHNDTGAPAIMGLAQSLENVPAADPWLVQMLLGEANLMAVDVYRMIARGNWTEVKDLYGKARACYEKAWQIDPSRPEAPVMVIHIAILDGDGNHLTDIQTWFRHATEARFDYWPAYKNMTAGLRLLSHNDRQALIAFGIQCADTERFDTDIPLHIIGVLKILRVMDNGAVTSWQTPEMYSHARETLLSYALEPSQQHRQRYFMTLLAVFAYFNHQWDDAVVALDVVHNQLDQAAVEFLDVTVPDLVGEVRTRKHPQAAAHLQAAEKLELRGQWADAISEYEKLVTIDLPAEVRQFAADRLHNRTLDNTFRTSEWVDVPFTDGLADWQVQAGQWLVQPDGSIIGIADPHGLMLRSRALLGRQFEVQCDIEIVERIGSHPNLGFVAWSPLHKSVCQMMLHPHDGSARMEPVGNSGPARPTFANDPVRNHLHWQINRDRARSWLNTQTLFGEQTLRDYPDDGYTHIGIGSTSIHAGTRLRISNLQIRRLQAAQE